MAKHRPICATKSKMSPDSVESSGLSNFSANSNDPVVDQKAQHLNLKSPGGGDPLMFIYSSPNTEFVDILKLALEEFEGLKEVVAKTVSVSLDSLYTAEYEVLDKVCDAFNKAASASSKLRKGTTLPGNNADLSSPKFLQRIINHCYNKAIDNEKALNKHYEPFSSCTYGETSFERMKTIIDELKPVADDVFVDLGSGVGQLVVHMAGGSKVKKAFGIEVAELPAKFAALLECEFRKLMKFYGKKVRQFSLELGNFLHPRYRDLITKEATIIFINNYAFTPDLESRIKHELLFELQTGTKIVSTKPYASVNKVINAREVNDFSSIAEITVLKHCDNPCSWTANNVTYYLHTVDHGKIEKYMSGLKPSSLRALEGRRSMTPSSSKNSNSRESSVSYRPASKKMYGPTTRKSWNAYVLGKQSIDETIEIKEELGTGIQGTQAYISDSESSEPERKRKRAKKQGKNKVNKVKPSKNVDLSEDAKDGIELMHQMTQAVSSGQSADSTKTTLLAGLSNNGSSNNEEIAEVPKVVKKRANFKQTDMMFPLSDAMPQNKRKKRTLNNDVLSNEPQTNSKYVHLDVFLSELRRTYELFLDNIHAVPNSTVKLEQPITVPAIQTPNLSLPNGTSVKPGMDDILQMFDRINAKYVDLGQDIGNLRKVLVSFVSNSTQVDAVPQQNHVHPISNGIQSSGVLPQVTNVNNVANGVQQQSSIDATAKYANLLSNDNSQNGAAYNAILVNYMNNVLTSKYSTTAKSISDLNQVASIALQASTAQHISPQQQSSVNQYANQLNGLQFGGMSNGLASLLDPRYTSAGQYNEAVAHLNNVLTSNNYSDAEKHDLLHRAIQNPSFSSVLMHLTDPNILNQMQQRVSASVEAFTSHPETSSANQLLTAQTALYTSQIKPEAVSETPSNSQTVQQYLNEVNKTEPQSNGKNKKTERKPRANAKRSKEVPTTPTNQTPIAYSTNNTQALQNQASNEASTSRPYMNTFNNHITHQPIGVEAILSNQLSIQSQLPLPKDNASFHSPRF